MPDCGGWLKLRHDEVNGGMRRFIEEDGRVFAGRMIVINLGENKNGMTWAMQRS